LKSHLIFWVERYFYNPNNLQKLLSFVLLPLSWLYCFMMYLRFKSKNAEDFGVKIISVGNLNVGGSGKTPLVSALALHFEDTAIILRGYGRESQGLYVVKDREKILCDVKVSGDEAMIYAQKLSDVIVIVSEDRKKGIKKAKEMGCQCLFLDDAYSKHDIKKQDILIDVPNQNSACLPAGPFRERLWKQKNALVLKEGRDFTRVVTLKNPTAKMSLVTAIARPERLDSFLPRVVSKTYFEDHHPFTKAELESILNTEKADSLLVTYKDYVKVKDFGLPLSLLDLDIEIQESVLESIL